MRFAVMFAFACLLFSAPVAAQEPQRLALLIGNQDYPADVGALNRPLEDVAILADALEAAGFEVTIAQDQTRDAMFDAVFAFADALSAAGPGATGFFYYAGHGAAGPDGANYIIPAGASVSSARHLISRGVEVDALIAQLSDALPEGGETGPALFFVFDACRNTLRLGDRSVGGEGRGFTVARERPGLFIAHSTLAGEFAPDDGAYARALAAEIRRPGQRAGRAFELANRAVARTRERTAVPSVANALLHDVCFISCPGEAGGAAPANASVIDDETFARAAIEGAEALRAYLILFPAGGHIAEARALLDELGADADASGDDAEALSATLEAIDTLDPFFDLNDALEQIVTLHGFDALTRAARNGDGRAAFLTGAAYQSGTFAPQNDERAYGLFSEGCARDYPPACISLATLMLTGTGGAQNQAEARRHFESACDAGYADGCRNLGLVYFNAIGVEADENRAFELVRRACDLRHPLSCDTLSYFYGAGVGAPQDLDESLRLMRYACTEGIVTSCHNLGVVYQGEQALERDVVQSARFHAMACDLGGAGNCNIAAWLYATSTDEAARNGAEAVRLARAAVDAEPLNMEYRDTLAAAYAEAGDFESAIREQSVIVEASRGARPEFQARLSFYLAGRPFRED